MSLDGNSNLNDDKYEYDAYADYPLHRIVEPGENDYLLAEKVTTKATDKQQQYDYTDFPGNIRMQLLVETYTGTYSSKSPLERPVVAAEVLQQWRQQRPPGRVLQRDAATDLWADVGDKKARQKISKLLRIAASRQQSSKLPTELPNELQTESSSQDPTFTHTTTTTTSTTSNSSNIQGKKTNKMADLIPATIVLHRNEREQLQCRIREILQNNVHSQVILVTGDRGSGKTTLVRSSIESDPALPQITAKIECNLFWCFDFMDVLVLLFRTIAKQLAQQPTSVRSKFQNELRSRFHPTEIHWMSNISTDFALLLEVLVSNYNSSPENGSSPHSAQQMIPVVARLLRVLSTAVHMNTVVFFDDFHRADPEVSFLVIELIKMATGNPHVSSSTVAFIIAVNHRERQNCQSSFSMLQNQFETQNSSSSLSSPSLLETIMLPALTEEQVREIVSTAFRVNCDALLRLSTGGSSGSYLGQQKTNPLYLECLLKSFLQNEILLPTVDGWAIDAVAHAHSPIDAQGNLQSLVRYFILQLPDELQNLIVASACLGTSFHPDLLTPIVGTSMSAPMLAMAVDYGVFQNITSVDGSPKKIAFAHDVFFDVARDLVPAGSRDSFDFGVGRKLCKAMDADELLEHIFVVMDNVMKRSAKVAHEKDTMAIWSLEAGKRASQRLALEKAAKYFQFGVTLLDPRHGWKDNYNLTLEIHMASAQVCFWSQLYEDAEELVDRICLGAKHSDSILARELYMQIKIRTMEYDKAIDYGLEYLEKSLSIKLPKNPSSAQVKISLVQLQFSLSKYSRQALLRLSQMSDVKQLTAMRFFSLLARAAEGLNHLLLLQWITTRMIWTTLKFGVCGASSIGLAYYSQFLSCGSGKDVETSIKYGQVALELLEPSLPDDNDLLSRVYSMYFGSVVSWKEPFQRSLEKLQQGVSLGHVTGQVEYALRNWAASLFHSEHLSLPKLDSAFRMLADQAKLFHLNEILWSIQPAWQATMNLLGQYGVEPRTLSGEAMKQDNSVAAASRRGDKGTQLWIQFHRARLSYILCEAEEAAALITDLDELLEYPYGCFRLTAVLALQLLITLAHGITLKKHRMVRRGIDRLRRWSRHSPGNVLGRLYLVEAEFMAHKNDNSPEVVSKYKDSIHHFDGMGLRGDQALATERLGKYFQKLEGAHQKEADSHLQEACRLYESWGAVTKVQQLRKEVSFYLKSRALLK